MDNFGAVYSIPYATGEARGDTIELTFRYEEGPLRDRFVYDGKRDTWHFVLGTPDSAGAWHLFADYDVRRVKPPLSPPGP